MKTRADNSNARPDKSQSIGRIELQQPNRKWSPRSSGQLRMTSFVAAARLSPRSGYSSVFNPIMPTGPATIPSLTAHTFPYASYFRFHLRLARAHECVRVLPSAAFARSTPPSPSAHYTLPCTIFSPIHGVPILTRSPRSFKHPRNKLLLLLFR